MQISEKIFEKEFEGKNQKDAYLKCCKWIASNVIAINNARNIMYHIEKVGGTFSGKVKVIFYVYADETEVFDHTCEVCREASSLFYMSGEKHKCESCKINPYRNRLQERLKLLKDGMKGVVLK